AVIVLRLYPAVIAGYLVVARRWRALGATIAAIGLGVAVTVAELGIARCADFPQALGLARGSNWLAQSREMALSPGNLSLSAFVARPLAFLWGAETSSAASAIYLAAIAIAALVTIRATPRGIEQTNRAFSLWIAATLLVSPVVWVHYLVLLLVPFSQLAAEVCARSVGRELARLTLAAYVLIAVEALLAVLLPMRFDDWHTLVAAQYGFGALLFGYSAIYRFAREPAIGVSRYGGPMPGSSR
ncbi:MAG TPA: glycosyltransferase 87 family protein, partial [Candidatus Binataceae bacterium]|nr:glycosyltransferase 87 family protein [Candidatus Binataceae bacterium]